MAQILINQVNKVFKTSGKDVVALKDINLDIKAGEFVCLLGPSGCGKSTLLNAVAGFALPSSGVITVDGKTVTAPGPDRGMVFQEYALFPWMTVGQNIAFGLEIQKKPKAEIDLTVNQLLELLHLGDFRDRFPKDLSGGMRQRVAIARALANDPVLLMADEPTGNLDTKNAAAVFDIFARLAGEEGRAVLVVTHDADLARRATRRIHLVDGRIVSDERG
jgi:NitT/TauT family transport system ATP-binding protein